MIKCLRKHVKNVLVVETEATHTILKVLFLLIPDSGVVLVPMFLAILAVM